MHSIHTIHYTPSLLVKSGLISQGNQLVDSNLTSRSLAWPPIRKSNYSVEIVKNHHYLYLLKLECTDKVLACATHTNGCVNLTQGLCVSLTSTV